MKRIQIAKTKSNANQGMISSNENENNRKVIRDIEEEIEQFESICKNFIESVPKQEAPSITSSHNDSNLGIADSLESDLNLQLEKDFEYLGLAQPYQEKRRAQSIAGFDRRSSKDLISDSHSINLGKTLENHHNRNNYRNQRLRQRKLEKDINEEQDNILDEIDNNNDIDLVNNEEITRDKKINFIINALIERGNDYFNNLAGLEGQEDMINGNINYGRNESFSSSTSSSNYSYSNSSDEENSKEDRTKKNILGSGMSSSIDTSTSTIKPSPQLLKENKKSTNLLSSPRLTSEPLSTSIPSVTGSNDSNNENASESSGSFSLSQPLNTKIKSKESYDINKTKKLQDESNSDKKIDVTKDEKSELEKKPETATSLLEKILDKRPPILPMNDGKENNSKLKKQKNKRRNSVSEKRYGNKRKLRSSNLETIKEDEELSSNKLPIRRVAKYSIDFKKDKPGQIIPHSMPRTRMPPSNKKQRIQSEIHSTLLSHTRQLQQRVFYLESKRLELQDLISEYELEKETLTKQLDKQTNTKGNIKNLLIL